MKTKIEIYFSKYTWFKFYSWNSWCINLFEISPFSLLIDCRNEFFYYFRFFFTKRHFIQSHNNKGGDLRIITDITKPNPVFFK